MLKIKIFYFIVLIFLFYFSYLLKNFQLLLVSICFFILFGMFFKKINKNILLVFFSFLFTITIVELGLFFNNDKKIINIKSEKNFTKHVKVKKTYLGTQPLSGVQHHKIVKNGINVIDSYYTINENNFRQTPQVNNLAKEKTLNFFGGSKTFGWGLNDDETLPYLIQAYFPKWKINNYAISGYGVHQMLAQITKEPDLIKDINILVTYIAHVPRANCKRDFTFGTPRYVLNKKNELIRSGYCNFGFFNKLPLPSIFGKIIKRSEIKILLDKIYFRKSLYNKEDVELFLTIIKEINKIIINKKNFFFVGYISQKTETDNYIIKKLKENKIKIIDLSLDENNKKYKIPLDGHPTKQANVERSLMIWENLKKN